jgi:long-chain acyl-CoA synthetase
MSGYWNPPDETKSVFTSDGWLRTGDMGFVNERGYFWITDRKKDMGLTEQALLEHYRQYLTSYKVPKVVEFRSEPLPKPKLGKILRWHLRKTPTL